MSANVKSHQILDVIPSHPLFYPGTNYRCCFFPSETVLIQSY